MTTEPQPQPEPDDDDGRTECPHCHGGKFLPHSHELPGRRP